jgi:glycosidase
MHWWVGMKDPNLQLLVHAPGIGSTVPKITHPHVTIKKVHKADSPNYLFIDLMLSPNAASGMFLLQFMRNGAVVAEYPYFLKDKGPVIAGYQNGFNSSDVIYLITPDRFANGDPGNDVIDTMRETRLDRQHDYARHGGDIRGIINRLDYIKDMGFTAIWITPLLENDMESSSYHGYAITDHYKVDPRFGSLRDYEELAQKCYTKGIKLIFDGVANHTGSKYWWMNDLPFRDWINYPDSFQNTSHRRTVNQDLYASEADKQLMVKGWFVRQMPDVNQSNPFMANYIIQNNIWWIKTLELSGIRQDTYPYSEKKFLEKWTCRIQNEFPGFSITGEEWSSNPLVAAYWQKGKVNQTGYNGCLRSPMDFPNQANLAPAFTEAEGWNTGLIRLYEGLANDFVYASPKDLLVFADNHDMDRLFTQVKENPAYHRMALTWVLTSRGIPQVYYGTEINMQNTAKPGDHGLIRSDFPGGWEGDTVNGFTGAGLNNEQKLTKDFLKKMLQWRKDKKVIHEGNTKHFVPQDAVYVYFRYDSTDTVMVILNKNAGAYTLDLTRFNEILGSKKTYRDVMRDKSGNLSKTLALEPMSATILEWR